MGSLRAERARTPHGADRDGARWAAVGAKKNNHSHQTNTITVVFASIVGELASVCTPRHPLRACARTMHAGIVAPIQMFSWRVSAIRSHFRIRSFELRGGLKYNMNPT